MGSVIQLEDTLGTATMRPRGRDTETDVQPGFCQILQGQLANSRFLALKNAVAAMDERDLNSETGQKSARFDAHGAATNDDGTFRKGRSGISFAVGPGCYLVEALKLGNDGFCAGGNDDVVRRQFPRTHADCARRRHNGFSFNDGGSLSGIPLNLGGVIKVANHEVAVRACLRPIQFHTRDSCCSLYRVAKLSGPQ